MTISVAHLLRSIWWFFFLGNAAAGGGRDVGATANARTERHGGGVAHIRGGKSGLRARTLLLGVVLFFLGNMALN